MNGETNVDHPKELTHISLCAGYGGIDLGLSRALGAIRTIAFSEIEAFACENLVAKMEAGWLDAAPIWTDLKTFPWEQFRGKVDILSGGFPCQPFSAAGQRTGDDDPRHLWPSIVRGIRELAHPPLVFFENVEGIISSKLKSDGWADPVGTPVLLHVLRELERLGYRATAGVFSAREVGAPHQRKRVFIMGVRSDLSDTGRALVSEMLSTTGRENVADPEYKRRSQREPSPRHRTELFTSGVPRTAYPAPRGAEQYEWEPPRVTMLTMGNAQQQRLQRDLDAHTPTPTKGRQIAHGHNTATSTQRRSTMGNANHQRSQGRILTTLTRGPEHPHTEPTPRPSSQQHLHRQTEPSMGGDADGAPCWVDYAELCESVDNRTDELRLLGNGVVPATAERGFRILWRELGAGS